MARSPEISVAVLEDIERIVRWYLTTVYQRWEGPGTLPFFADRARVGSFAVNLEALRAKDPNVAFQLLITLASYQSRRDVDIMRIQREIPPRQARAMTSPSQLKTLVERSRCEHVRSARTFDEDCDVRRDLLRDTTTCGSHPRLDCHVKDATSAIGRMGDMGKMSTSAWLHLGAGGIGHWVNEVTQQEPDPHLRAEVLVQRFQAIYRIGRKLASMFVTALAVPELYGHAPWHPAIDGSRIVVIDANVARAIAMWRQGRGSDTYSAVARWMIAAADHIDLAALRRGLPSRSPRLVQQAIYLFRSRANRTAAGDACAESACDRCPSRVCPFVERRLSAPTEYENRPTIA